LKDIRIAIGPGEIAGYFSNLKVGFDAQGVPCEHFVLASNIYRYGGSNYFLKSIFEFIPDWYRSEFIVIKFLGYLTQITIRLIIFVYALINFDVFIFSGAGSFFKFYELPILKLFKKKILVVYLGSDARPPFFNGRHLDISGSYANPDALKFESIKIIKMIRRVEKYADAIINHTATAQFFTRSFIRHVALGVPMKIDSTKKNSHRIKPKKIRILHAPSRPFAKGSLVFRKIIDELRNEGYLIQFTELVGVPNKVVLKELRRCDFVIDELYSDIPMAMFASEAAVCGKPTVVGGYYADQYKLDNTDQEIPPSLYVLPNNIKEAIRSLLDDENLRLQLGKRAQKFIQEHWNTNQVAKNYLRLINECFPKRWESKPEEFSYYWGWGLSKENWHMQVQRYVSLHGQDALFLDHNQNLKGLVLQEIQKRAEVKK
jgi:glycosyltransferase involved in cell wall biosynthesis